MWGASSGHEKTGQKPDRPFAIIDKERPRPNETAVMNVIGDVKGKNCIMIDDMIDTAGTITSGANALIDLGANSVFAACSHGVFPVRPSSGFRILPLKNW